MVRLALNNTVEHLTNIVSAYFKFQQHFTHIVPVNYPDVEPCIYALWHNHQFALYGLPNKTITNVNISGSNDGRIIGDSIENVFGFKVIRGSHAHSGAAEAAMKMIETLKNGENIAITVDGPRGPLHVVKGGIIRIAKHSGRPIVPMIWYSPNFNLIKLNSWDKLEVPIFDVRLINLYGEPMYIPEDIDSDSEEKYRLELQKRLLCLLEQAPAEYEKVYWHGLWRRK